MPNGDGTQPIPMSDPAQPYGESTVPRPKGQGFWGILKNRVLPAIGPAAQRLAMSFGTPEQAAGARTGAELDIQNRELARQAQFDVPALAEAQLNLEKNRAMAPSQITTAAAGAESAQKAANIAPGSQAERHEQEIQQATAPLEGDIRILNGLQTQPSTPSAPPAQIPPPPIGLGGPSGIPPSPIAGAVGATGTPSPHDFIMGKLFGAPEADRDLTPDGKGGYVRNYRYKGTNSIARSEPVIPPTQISASMPPRDVNRFLPPGVNILTATPEQLSQAEIASRTTTVGGTTTQYKTDAAGNQIPVEVPSSRTIVRGGSPSQGTSAPFVKGPGAPTIQGKVPAGVAKAYEDYNGALTRQDVMNKSLPEALAGNQQAQINILANHLGMTAGIQKGSRINQAMWNEAMNSAPWWDTVMAKFTHVDQATGDHVWDGLKSGVNIPPEALKQMVSLAGDRVNAQKAAWQREIQASKTGYGMSGGGNTPPSASAPNAATPKWNPKTARFE